MGHRLTRAKSVCRTEGRPSVVTGDHVTEVVGRETLQTMMIVHVQLSPSGCVWYSAVGSIGTSGIGPLECRRAVKELRQTRHQGCMRTSMVGYLHHRQL